MNTAQQILAVVLKSMFCDLFYKSLTQQEVDLIERIRNFNNLKIQSLFSGKTILRWDSAIGYTLACYVGPEGFHFSEVEIYKSSTRKMKGLVNKEFTYDAKYLEMVEEEIKELKTMFRLYSQYVEEYIL